MSTVATSIRLKADIKELAQRQAEQEHRSLSNYIEYLIIQSAKRLEKSAQKDDSLMTKEEFFEKLDKSLAEIKEGKVYSLSEEENLDDFVERVSKKLNYEI